MAKNTDNLSAEERTRFREIAARFNAFSREHGLKTEEAVAVQGVLAASLASDTALEVFPGALELTPLPAAAKDVLRKLISQARVKADAGTPVGNRNADVAIFVVAGVLVGASIAYVVR